MKNIKWVIMGLTSLVFVIILILPVVLNNKVIAREELNKNYKAHTIDSFVRDFYIGRDIILQRTIVNRLKADTGTIREEQSSDIFFGTNHAVIEDENVPLGYLEDQLSSTQMLDEIEVLANNQNYLIKGSKSTTFEKLDLEVLFEFAEGGLTEEEEVTVEHYLKSNLTIEEYTIAMILYLKYAGVYIND